MVLGSAVEGGSEQFVGDGLDRSDVLSVEAAAAEVGAHRAARVAQLRGNRRDVNLDHEQMVPERRSCESLLLGDGEHEECDVVVSVERAARQAVEGRVVLRSRAAFGLT